MHCRLLAARAHHNQLELAILNSSPAANPMRTANIHSQLIRLQRKRFLHIEAEDEEAREAGWSSELIDVW